MTGLSRARVGPSMLAKCLAAVAEWVGRAPTMTHAAAASDRRRWWSRAGRRLSAELDAFWACAALRTR